MARTSKANMSEKQTFPLTDGSTKRSLLKTRFSSLGVLINGFTDRL